MISIIVPVYNSETFLRDTINSILCQSFKDFELILIDDGSTDLSLEICYEYAMKDERVKVFSKENGGVSSARNLGLKLAIGKYIAFIDSDDFIESDFLECLFKDIESSKSDISVCGFKHLYVEEYRKITNKNNSHNVISFSIINNPISLYYNNASMPLVWNKLYRREVIGDVEFDESLNYGEDFLFVAMVMLKSKKSHLEMRLNTIT